MCRQSADTYRITWRELMHHLPHAIFHLDKGLLHTVKGMTFSPGEVIREYIDGKRIMHFNPLLFVILLGGIASILFSMAHVQLLNKEIDLDKIEVISSTIAHKYFVLNGVLFILLLSIADYFFFRYKAYTLPEMIISNTFQVGQLMFFMVILFFPLLLLQKVIQQQMDFHLTLRPVLKFVIMAYLFYVRYQLYDAKGNVKRFIVILVELTVIYILYNVVLAWYLVRLLLT